MTKERNIMKTPPDSLKNNPTLHELAKQYPGKTYRDLVQIQEEIRLKRDAFKEACILGEMRKDRTPLANMKKRAEEAEGELSIMKGIETNRVKEAQARCDHLQNELDRVKKENNDLYNKIADLTEVVQSKDYFRDPDYKYLIEENHRLEQERNELLTVNKQLNQEAENKLTEARKAGL
jgi:chromosome segregation ATPase